MERLQKIIASSGYTSRREAEKLITLGKVKVNGEIVKTLGTKAKKGNIIEVGGNVIENNKNYVYYILNKPRQVISSVKDEHGRKTVVDLIPSKERIYPVGRLDYDTTGLIILTNDGNLTNKLMHPSSNIAKTYFAKVSGLVTPDELKILQKGVMIDGIKTAKAKVKLKDYDKKTNRSSVRITIYEGRNHQIKRMFEVINHEVLKLKREKYANLDLTGLSSGEYRRLTFKEVAILYSLVK